jgi:HEAT repeat protein
MKTKSPVPFSEIIKALMDDSKSFPPQYLHRFSDLSEENCQSLNEIWLQVAEQRRINLLEDLEDLLESDTTVLFDEIGQMALKDPNPKVRASAIRLLVENARESLARTFIKIAINDPDEFVRAAATSALGQYVYEGEMEEIQKETKEKVENFLLLTLAGSDATLVRRRALEAISFSSRDEVPSLIEKAFQSKDISWQISALFAMGRSMDNARWEKAVLENIPSPDSEISFEAVRAAGEMELQSARTLLMEMLKDYEELDDDVRGAVIWSLSQIGGEGVRKKLEELAGELDDDEEIEYIEEALENLEFTEDLSLAGMFDLEMLKGTDLDTIIDLEHDELDDEDFDKSSWDEEEKE